MPRPKCSPSVDLVCDCCAAVFPVTVTAAERGRGRFCSRACLHAARSVSLVCEWCGTAFDRPRSEVTMGRGRFCCRACRDAGMTTDPATRFWAKVDRSGGPNACWPFLGFRDEDGYGNFWLDGRNEYAHRVAFLLSHGHWPEPNGNHVCDNPTCCNPAHIYAGTQKRNMIERDERGRHWVRSGEEHPAAKLTEADVRAIRAAYAADEADMRTLARRYGVAYMAIFEAIHRKTWKHVR